MRITGIRMKKVTREGAMKAVVSITLDNEFVVHDLKVIEGKKGLFVAMPSARYYDGATGKEDFRDIAHPINTNMRDYVKDIVIGAYVRFVVDGEEDFIELNVNEKGMFTLH